MIKLPEVKNLYYYTDEEAKKAVKEPGTIQWVRLDVFMHHRNRMQRVINQQRRHIKKLKMLAK